MPNIVCIKKVLILYIYGLFKYCLSELENKIILSITSKLKYL